MPTKQGKTPTTPGGFKANRTRGRAAQADPPVDERELARKNQKPKSSRATPRGPNEKK